MSHKEKTLDYFLARKSHFLVVSFVGHMTDAMMPRLEKCRQDIQAHSDIRALVLHFGDMLEVGLDAIPVLAQIQAYARSRQVQIRLSGLSGEILEKMLKKGVTRRPELATDLKEALLHVARLAANTSSGGEGSQVA